jgi:hypothetical protein
LGTGRNDPQASPDDATGRAIQVSGIALAIISAVQGVGTKLETHFTTISTSLSKTVRVGVVIV